MIQTAAKSLLDITQALNTHPVPSTEKLRLTSSLAENEYANVGSTIIAPEALNLASVFRVNAVSIVIPAAAPAVSNFKY
ncbi:hypothetical protein [Tritonibacter mobilis]|uniref:hypothetical protein n=1 Tax=Tritonibacter mobilis TaxID=379347 RepID=UPI0013A643FC|nr:hypothetical protein [Tritonibacter mobilis]